VFWGRQLKKGRQLFWGKRCTRVAGGFLPSKWPGSFTALAPPLPGEMMEGGTRREKSTPVWAVPTIAKARLVSVAVFTSLVAFAPSSLICHFSQPLLLLSNVNRYDYYVTGAIRYGFCFKITASTVAQVEFSLSSRGYLFSTHSFSVFSENIGISYIVPKHILPKTRFFRLYIFVADSTGLLRSFNHFHVVGPRSSWFRRYKLTRNNCHLYAIHVIQGHQFLFQWKPYATSY